MKVVVIGSGVCASDLEGLPDRIPPGVWVEWNGGHILFDLGEGVRFRLKDIGVRYPEIKHVAISHAHADHFTLPQFLQAVFCHGVFRGIKADELNLYMPDTIVEQWPMIFKFYVPEAPAPDVHSYEDEYLWPKLHFFRMSSVREAAIGNAVLKSERVYHGLGRCDAVAFRLEAEGKVFAYSGDTGDCEGIRKIAQGADLFICEASAQIGSLEFSKKYGHLTPYEAGFVARECGIKQLVLTHYSGLDSEASMIEDCRKADFKGDLFIAQDFQTFKV